MNNIKKYIIFWLSQSVSQLGSSITGFALILWVYGNSHSALTVSLMTFCNYVPYILISLFAGTLVDRHKKKSIMLISDTVAALGTAAIWIAFTVGNLQVWHIYLVNIVIGMANAFQSPAANVATRMLVPKDKISNVSGMNSLSGNLVMVLTPVLAAAVYSFAGLDAVLLIDFGSFIFAFCVLLFFIRIPDDMPSNKKYQSIFNGTKEGFRFMREHKLILYIVFTMALLNFFSRLTYENILSPMILARCGDNSAVLGAVNTVMGVAGILGGILVSIDKKHRDSIKMIYISAAVSFLLGDFLMGVSRNTVLWCIAGTAASLPIPFINAGQNVIMYREVPENMQGRIFAVRNAIQYSTIPVGILLGGFLADYVFEPFMRLDNAAVRILSYIVGTGTGSGMACMFLCTGILGFIFSVVSYSKVRKLLIR